MNERDQMTGTPERRARAELGDFLRARRARLQPADVGLTEGSASGRRRTPGLRREEVAQLSGVGVTWYTWLEQGRDVSASGQVIDALARALLLTEDEHSHLRQLAGLPAPDQAAGAAEATPRLQLLVDSLAPNIASIVDVHLDFVVWNEPYARLRYDPAAVPRDRRNVVWMMFTNRENRLRMLDWEAAARSVLSQLRAAAGRNPGDARFAELVAALTEASPEFRAWWAEYPVRYFRPAVITLYDKRRGKISLELFQLRLVEHLDLILVLQVPVSQDDARELAALARA